MLGMLSFLRDGTFLDKTFQDIANAGRYPHIVPSSAIQELDSLRRTKWIHLPGGHSGRTDGAKMTVSHAGA
jgi:hypothetical protein